MFYIGACSAFKPWDYNVSSWNLSPEKVQLNKTTSLNKYET